MNEENQMVNQTQPGMVKIEKPTFSQNVRNMSLRRAKVAEDRTNQNLDDMLNSSSAINEESYNQTATPESKKLHKKVSNTLAVAAMIKNDAINNAPDEVKDEWRHLESARDVMNKYWELNPEDEVYNKISEFVNSDRDPYDFGLEMGRIQTPEEESFRDHITNFFNTLYSPLKLGGKGVRDMYGFMANGAEEVDVNDPKRANKRIAMENYMTDHYGDVWNEDDWKDFEYRYNLNPNLLDDYLQGQKPLNSAIETGLGFLFTYGGFATPEGASFLGAISAGGELPIAKDIIGVGFEFIEEIGGALYDGLMWVLPDEMEKEFESLPEETKTLLRGFAGGYILYKAYKKTTNAAKKTYNKAVETKNAIKKTIKDVVDNPKEYIDKAKEYIKETKEKISNSDSTEIKPVNELETLETAEEIEGAKLDLVDKIMGEDSKAINFDKNAGPRTRKIRDMVNGTLEKLSGKIDENITTYEELIDAVDTQNMLYKDWVDRLLELNKKRYKPSETISTRTMRGEYGEVATPQTVDPIGDGIRILREIYSDDGLMQQKLDIIEQRRQNKGLNMLETNALAREITNGIKLYKEGTNVQLDNSFVTRAENARTALKDFIRGPFKDKVPGLYDALDYIEQAWSDGINTSSTLNRAVGSKRAYKSKMPRKETWQEGGKTIFDTINSKGKNLIKKALKDYNYDPITREQDLPGNLEWYYKLDNQLGRENLNSKIENFFKEEYAREKGMENTNWGEGEVIEPKKYSDTKAGSYIDEVLETVDVVEPGTVEASEPIIEALNAEQLLKLENMLERSGFTPEEVEVIKEISKQNVEQSPLFDVEEGPAPKDLNGNEINNKKTGKSKK